MELTDPEKKNVDQLTKAYMALARKYTDDDNRPMHVPHAVHVFSHFFFHEVFEEAAAVHAHEQTQEQLEDMDDDDVLAFNIEPVVRKTFEMILLTGIEFGKRMHTAIECRCVESVGDVIEAALHSGECGR